MLSDIIADESLARRVQLFVVIQAGLTILIVLALILIATPSATQAGLILGTTNLVFLGVTYALNGTRYGLIMVYIAILIPLLLLSVAAPLSGKLDGSAWSLYQIPPLIATLVLNRPKTTISITVIAGSILISSVVLEFMGWIPVEMVVPFPILAVNLINQVIVLVVIALTVWTLARRSNRDLQAVEAAKQQIEAQLQRERELTLTAEQANHDLATSLKALQQRDERLAQETKEQGRLRQLLRQTTTPVIPVMDGVLIMPLIGAWDAKRADEVINTLLEGIERSHARMIIIDVTGLDQVAPDTGSTLLAAAEACRLLGATPVLAGISPDIAQTLVMHNTDLNRLITVANLQSAVAYAFKQTNRQNSAQPVTK